jgi:DNA helicase-2/ATP-dependent DNA helicase PcrA
MRGELGQSHRAKRRPLSWSGARSQIATLERALRERGLPVEVVGLGGLLDTPEVRDVVSTMQVLADPTAGASLLRLLTGARWRIGPQRPRGALIGALEASRVSPAGRRRRRRRGARSRW